MTMNERNQKPEAARLPPRSPAASITSPASICAQESAQKRRFLPLSAGQEEKPEPSGEMRGKSPICSVPPMFAPSEASPLRGRQTRPAGSGCGPEDGLLEEGKITFKAQFYLEREKPWLHPSSPCKCLLTPSIIRSPV